MEQLDGSWERAGLSESMVGNREIGNLVVVAERKKLVEENSV